MCEADARADGRSSGYERASSVALSAIGLLSAKDLAAFAIEDAAQKEYLNSNSAL